MLKIELAKVTRDVKRALKEDPDLTNGKILAKTPTGFEKLVETIEEQIVKVGGATIKLARSLHKLHEMTQARYQDIGVAIEESTNRAYSKSTIFKLCRAGSNIAHNSDLEHVIDIEKHYIISRCEVDTIVDKFKLVGDDVKFGTLKVNEATREELKKALGFKTTKKAKTTAKVVSLRPSKAVKDWADLTRNKVLDDLRNQDEKLADELETVLNKVDRLFQKRAS